VEEQGRGTGGRQRPGTTEVVASRVPAARSRGELGVRAAAAVGSAQ
jgi:hypothetical protein